MRQRTKFQQNRAMHDGVINDSSNFPTRFSEGEGGWQPAIISRRGVDETAPNLGMTLADPRRSISLF